jgi:Protein of unknown function (DUF2510)
VGPDGDGSETSDLSREVPTSFRAAPKVRWARVGGGFVGALILAIYGTSQASAGLRLPWIIAAIYVLLSAVLLFRSDLEVGRADVVVRNLLHTTRFAWTDVVSVVPMSNGWGKTELGIGWNVGFTLTTGRRIRARTTTVWRWERAERQSREVAGLRPPGMPWPSGLGTSSIAQWPLQSSSRSAAPAGWYPDPGSPRRLRWWNGSAWTEHLQDLG